MMNNNEKNDFEKNSKLVSDNIKLIEKLLLTVHNDRQTWERYVITVMGTITGIFLYRFDNLFIVTFFILALLVMLLRVIFWERISATQIEHYSKFIMLFYDLERHIDEIRTNGKYLQWNENERNVRKSYQYGSEEFGKKFDKYKKWGTRTYYLAIAFFFLGVLSYLIKLTLCPYFKIVTALC